MMRSDILLSFYSDPSALLRFARDGEVTNNSYAVTFPLAFAITSSAMFVGAGL